MKFLMMILILTLCWTVTSVATPISGQDNLSHDGEEPTIIPADEVFDHIAPPPLEKKNPPKKPASWRDLWGWIWGQITA